MCMVACIEDFFFRERELLTIDHDLPDAAPPAR